jgi:chemotaxis protein MotB
MPTQSVAVPLPPVALPSVIVIQARPAEQPEDVLQGNLPFRRLQAGTLPSDEPGAAPPFRITDLPRTAPASDATRDAKPPAAEPATMPAAQIASALAAIVPTAPVPAAPVAVAPPPPASGGDRITQLDMNSAAFFDSGSATLSKSGEAILDGVAGDIKSERYKGYQVTVEGHTDDTAIATARFPSNWELSTARASAVVHFLLDRGIPAQRLRAAGYADTFPKAPNRDAKGNPIPENQAKNRRVVIKLERIESAAP